MNGQFRFRRSDSILGMFCLNSSRAKRFQTLIISLGGIWVSIEFLLSINLIQGLSKGPAKGAES